jgi:anti-sigma factor RsiW
MREACTRFEAEISALIDGELPAPEAAAVEAHVRSCPACSVLARDLAAVGRTMRAVESEAPPEPVSPGFRARVLASVGAERRAPREAVPAPVPSLAGRILPWLPAASAAAASFAAVLVGGAYLGGRAVDLPADRPEVPTAAPAAGLPDRARLEILAAFGNAPDDPAVRAAFEREFGFDPAARSPSPAPAGVAAAPSAPSGTAPGADAVDPSGPDLWVGSLRFETPGAYDAYTAWRDRARGMEMAVASRVDVDPGQDPVTVAEARPVPPPPGPLARALEGLVVGAPAGGDGSASWQGIVVFPLSRPGAAVAGPLPLSLPAAMEAGRAVVRDAPGRSAATVLVSNLDPDRPLLVLAGEVLEGGRADRIVSRDALLPAGARNVAVPVYEAEAGRSSSHPYGTRFRSVAGVAGSRVRGLALGQARPEDMREFLRGRLDLLDVTNRLHRSLADAWSERGAAAPVLRTLRPRTQEMLRALQDPAVVGFAVAQGREVLGVEVFGSHELLVREAGRILEGCALESSTYPGGGRPPLPSDVAALIAAGARGVAIPAGEGSPAEVGFVAMAQGLLGSGVVHGDRVLHASVLPGGLALGGGARGPGSDGRGGPGATAPGSTGGGSGPAPYSGGGGEGGASGPPPAESGGGEGKRPDPPPTPGERPR